MNELEKARKRIRREAKALMRANPGWTRLQALYAIRDRLTRDMPVGREARQ